MKVRILKRFNGPDGKPLVVGSVVDLEGRNLEKLIDQRFVALATDPVISSGSKKKG